jgi:20S proteasome alpha/beta subunit
MTTIAYRDGVIAADTGMTVGGSRLGRIVKIARNESGALAGAAGSAGYNAKFLDWFRGGAVGDPPEARETERSFDRGVVFHADGVIDIYEPTGVFHATAPYFAFGSGRPEALGALFMGATAEQAVRAAIEHDEATFGEVLTVLRHVEQLTEAAE